MSRGPQIFQAILHGFDDAETLVYFTQKDEPSVGRDGGALEIYPDGLFLAFTTSEHLGTPKLPFIPPYIR